MSNAVLLKPLPVAAAFAGNEVSGFAAANLLNDALGVVCKMSGGANDYQLFVLDLGSDVVVDSLVLLGLTGAKTTWNLRIDVATAAQGSAFAAPGTDHYSYPVVGLLAGSAPTSTGRGRSYWEAPAGGPSAARYVRVIIYTGVIGAAVTVARAVIGQRFRPTRNFDYGAVFGVRDTGTTDRSRRGALLRNRGVKFRTVGLPFNSLYRDEIEGVVNALLEKLGSTGPVALILDPDAHAQRQNRIWFGTFEGDLGSIWAKANAGFQWQANIVDLEPILGDA